ncbi:MAG: EpsG family protein [Bacteroidota bacterium]
MSNIRKKTTHHKSNVAALWLLSIVYPLLTFITALKNFSNKKYRVFIILFGALYGFTFIPISKSDGQAYKDTFLGMKDYTFTKYINDISSIADDDSDFPDIYAFTLFFIAKKISDDPRVFFLITGIFYFWMLIALMSSIWSMAPSGWGQFYFWFFLGCIFVLNFSAGINGVRFGMAYMVFGYGALNLILKKKIKFLLIASLSILIHFSLLYMVLFLVAFYLAGYPRQKNFLYVFLAIALVSSIFSTFIAENVGLFGTTIENKFNEYTDAGFMEKREEHTEVWRWYVNFDKYSTFYFVNIAMLLIRFFASKIRHDDTANRLFSFALIIFGASIISGGLVDSISNRYILISNLFALVYLLYISYLNPGNLYLSRISRIYRPIFILHALVVLRADLYTVSPWLLFGNPIVMVVMESDMSIQDIIMDQF